MLITPRKPWSRFLNLRWSKIWIAITDDVLTVLQTTNINMDDLQNTMHLHAHIKVIIPRWTQSFLHDRRCVGLLAVNGKHGEWVRKTE